MSTYTVRPAARQVRETRQTNSRNETAKPGSSQTQIRSGNNSRSVVTRRTNMDDNFDGAQQRRYDEQRKQAIERMQNETDIKAVEKEEERRRKEEEKRAEYIRRHERTNAPYEPHFLTSNPGEIPVASTTAAIREARLAKLASSNQSSSAAASASAAREEANRQKLAQEAQRELASGRYGYRLGDS